MIEERLTEIKEELPSGVKLVAVSKFHPLEDIMMAFLAGQTCFGENRPQEFETKAIQLPPEIEWHFIGHLQTNKLKIVLPHAHLVQSVDSERLLEAIDTWGFKKHRVTNILLEVHIGAESTKGGFTPDEVTDIIRRYCCGQELPPTNRATLGNVRGGTGSEANGGVERSETFVGGNSCPQPDGEWKNIRICGLMGMASHTDDEDRIREDFASIKSLYDSIRAVYPQMTEFKELSIGMSGDWRIALEYGATIVRIGTAIFGERKYL